MLSYGVGLCGKDGEDFVEDSMGYVISNVAPDLVAKH